MLLVLFISLCPGHTSHSLSGRTPCCTDRLTTLTCQRLALKHPARFAVQCRHSADFAFVQCCSSCFDRRFVNSSGLYKDTVKRLINQSRDCRDVRGNVWCERFVRRQADHLLPEKGSRRSFWEPWFRQGCEAFPFAFRVCRASCGFCSTGQKRATVTFDHTIAIDREKCPSTHSFSIKEDQVDTDFDPLASLDVDEFKRVNGDYFVVLEHDYVVHIEDDDE